MSASPIAIVTGGGRGLGRSTVEALARRGVSSILTYHNRWINAERIEVSGGQAI